MESKTDTRASTHTALSRWAWLPIPAIIAGMVAVHYFAPPGGYENPTVLFLLSFIFTTLTSITVSILLAKSFLTTGAPGLLFMNVGVLIWGFAGPLGPLLVRTDPNKIVTSHNLLALSAAIWQLAGVAFWIGGQRAVRLPGAALALSYVAATTFISVIFLAVVAEWTPVFFIQGEGGTPVRAMVLVAAILMFVMTSVLLLQRDRESASGFARWYAYALLLLATGLAGVIPQTVMGGWEGWTGRATLWLGGVYFLISSFASVRESGAWRVSLQETMRESQQRIAEQARLLDLATDAIFIRDENDRVVYWNRGSEIAYGYTAQEAMGQHKPTLLRTRFPVPLEEIRAVLLKEGVWSGELVHISKDGREIMDFSRWVVDRSPGATTYRILETNTDITARKALEAELQRRGAELETQVAQRTAELRASMARMHVAERLASVGTLAAGLGHDIANLLLPVRMRLDVLEAQSPPDQHEDFAAIKQAMRHLTDLSAGMRLIAMDPARADASEHVADLAVWWTQVEGVLRAALPRGVTLRSNLPSGFGAAIPRHTLAQATFNLVQNAGEALAQNRSGTVVVGATIDDRDPTRVNIAISDDGPGMTPEVAARCFEPYFSTKGRSISTGMGLSLVKGLIEASGGSIALQTGPGQGATFTITLPQAGEAGKALKPDKAAATAAITVANPRTAALASMMLGSLGVKVLDAAHASGSAAPDGSAGPASTRDASAPPIAAPASDIWVVSDPTTDSLAAFLNRQGQGTPRPARLPRVVLLDGQGDVVRSLNAAHAGAVIRIPHDAKPAELRRALAEAVEGGKR